MSEMRVQHSVAEAEAVCRLAVFEDQHWQAVSNVEEAAQLAMLEHCFGSASAVEAAQAVVLAHYSPAAGIVAEEAALAAVLEHCLAVARTVVEVAANHYWLAEVAAEEAASKAEEFAQALVLQHCSQVARIAVLAAAK